MTATDAPTRTPSFHDPSIHEIPTAKIHPSPYNPRTVFTDDDLAELGESIRAKGVLQPLLVEADADNPGSFFLVDGERRWRAAQIVSASLLPCIVRRFNAPEERIEAMLVSTLQRADLTPLDEANAYRKLAELDINQTDIAARVGRSKAHVSKRLALLKLPDQVQEHVVAGAIPLDTAARLAAFPAKQAQALVDDAVADDGTDLADAITAELEEHERVAARKAHVAEVKAEWKKKGAIFVEASWGQDWREVQRGEKPTAVYVDAWARVTKLVPRDQAPPAAPKSKAAAAPSSAAKKRTEREERAAQLAEVTRKREAHLAEHIQGNTSPRSTDVLGGALDVVALLQPDDEFAVSLGEAGGFLSANLSDFLAESKTPKARDQAAAALLLSAIERDYADDLTWHQDDTFPAHVAYVQLLMATGYIPDPLELEYTGITLGEPTE